MNASGAVSLRGRFTPPGDKSVGHRLAFLAALAKGRSRLEGFAPGQDCGRTLELLDRLGVRTKRTERPGSIAVEIEGRDGARFDEPDDALDAGNSGTTARMACGILAGQRFDSRLVGDESLSRRPFRRVVDPLTRMGGSFLTNGGCLPLTVRGGRSLQGIDYELPVPSAQVKTAVLLAGLAASGTTTVHEPLPSRNHTELALAAFGSPPQVDGGTIRIEGGVRLQGGVHVLPGDFSSAAFFIGGACVLPGSALVVDHVGLNPTRTALLDVLRDMGASIEIEPAPPREPAAEPAGRIVVRSSSLHGATVPARLVPSLIDEIPILAVVAAFADGPTRIEGASELRVKESDRLAAIVEGLRALGAGVEELGDGFVVHGRGGAGLRAATLASHGDHRMVMAWTMASLGVDGACRIDHLEQVRVSYPGFFQTLEELCR